MVAVASNFVNAIGRLMWGALSDRIRSKYLIMTAAVVGIGGVEATYWCLYRLAHNQQFFPAPV